MRHRPYSDGFTAIELTLVLAVLVVAAVAVLPGMPAFMRSQQLRATAARLADMARYAGDWSVLHERTVALSFDEEAREFVLEVVQENPEEMPLAMPLPEGESVEIQTESEPVIEAAWQRLPLPEHVEFTGGEKGEGERLEPGEAILFYPDGRSEDAILVIASGEQRYTVRISRRRGRVTVEKGDALEEGIGAEGTR